MEKNIALQLNRHLIEELNVKVEKIIHNNKNSQNKSLEREREREGTGHWDRTGKRL